MKDNISPEEKLLRLIKGQKRTETTADKVIPVSTSTLPKPDLKPLQNQSFLWLGFYRYVVSLRKKIIAMAFLVSSMYLVVSLVYPWVGLKKIKLPKITSPIMREPEIRLEKKGIKPYEFYLEGIQGRQIFSIKSGQERQRPISGANVDLIKDISLVGIIAGENPQAIVEDKNTHKSYYLNKGQFIGEFQLEDIREGKIILNYHGQRYELYL